jgi:hypothetical protein
MVRRQPIHGTMSWGRRRGKESCVKRSLWKQCSFCCPVDSWCLQTMVPENCKFSPESATSWWRSYGAKPESRFLCPGSKDVCICFMFAPLTNTEMRRIWHHLGTPFGSTWTSPTEGCPKRWFSPIVSPSSHLSIRCNAGMLHIDSTVPQAAHNVAAKHGMSLCYHPRKSPCPAKPLHAGSPPRGSHHRQLLASQIRQTSTEARAYVCGHLKYLLGRLLDPQLLEGGSRFK